MTESQDTIKTKTSEDGKYQAEWFSDYIEEGSLIVNNILTMYSLKDDKEKLFELELNDYRAVDPCVEFFEHPETGETVFTCNVFHGSLALFNMKGEIINEMACWSKDEYYSISDDEPDELEDDEYTQANMDVPYKFVNDELKLRLAKLRSYKDKFHNKVLHRDDKFMILETWFWGAMFPPSIYKIDEMITTFNYHPVLIPEYGYIKETNKVKYGDEEYEVDYWYENWKKIEGKKLR